MAAATVAAFTARPVWHAGHELEMNEQLRFAAELSVDEGEKPVLRLTAANPCRVTVDGEFAWYGPVRAAKGFFRVDEVPLALAPGRHRLEIEVAGYNIGTHSAIAHPSFLLAEVTGKDGRILAKTAEKGDFSAVRTARLAKVNHYSYQRAFAEVYDLPWMPGAELALAEQAELKLLPRRSAAPETTLMADFTPVGRGTYEYLDKDVVLEHEDIRGVCGDPARGYRGYTVEEAEFNTWYDSIRVVAGPAAPVARAADDRYEVKSGEYVLFDSPADRTGFFELDIECLEPGELRLMYDEVLIDGRIDPKRNATADEAVWRFSAPGKATVATFEPYTAKFAQAFAKGGRFRVSAPRLRLYRNALSRRASFRCSDRTLERIFAAAEETFAQNAAELFTDCPGRERACWNCDAYFTGRAAQLLSADSSVETAYLENYALPEYFPGYPQGMFPMCYPSETYNRKFIPSWALFMVLELEEYMNERGGERFLADMMKPRILALVRYLDGFLNADGLLENLPSWVFVDWSRANDLVKGVNYPNNMVYAAALEAVGRMYSMPECTARAAKIRATVRAQSIDADGWYRDQAVRGGDGKLAVLPERTEACQYYAFYFRVADAKRDPVLYARIVKDFGPKRRETKAWPEIAPCNAFIGNYLRLGWLSEIGESRQVCDELHGYFGYMAEQTGTLWEFVKPVHSCCHGFTSHVVLFLARDIAGLRKIDYGQRLVVFEPPSVPVGDCEMTIPTKDGPLTAGWKRNAEGGVEKTLRLPAGWKEAPVTPGTVDFTAVKGPVKPVNGVGQPPLQGWDGYGLFHYLKEAGIPYSRLHDVGGAHGGDVFVDIPNLFRDFDADETKAENYDFHYTDRLLKALVENGVEPYFRLGVSIENSAGRGGKYYRIVPPKDFGKWARICEHVIRHYTEGWADGFRMKISHWEIWNEPGDFEVIEKSMMWKAPFEEYIRLYITAAKHLKAKFPGLMIGGYASCGFYGVSSSWCGPDSPRAVTLLKELPQFLAAVREAGAPLDYFSFHCYDRPANAEKQIAHLRRTLDAFGFTKTEMSLNEWIPCSGGPKPGETGSLRQAAEIGAMLALMQNGPVDDAEIYDARVTGGQYCPFFDPETKKPRPAYRVYLAFNELRRLGGAVELPPAPEGVYLTAASDGKGDAALFVANISGALWKCDFDFGGWQADGPLVFAPDTVRVVHFGK